MAALAPDANTLTIVFVAFSLCSCLVLVPLAWVHLRFTQLQLKARESNRELFEQIGTTPSRVMSGVLGMLLSVAMATSLLVAPWLAAGAQDSPGVPYAMANHTPSSINFCEEDFVHSGMIAEPVNTASSLMSYPPLAILGLSGLASSPRRTGQRLFPFRYVVVHLIILAIGVGSAALHASLTAVTQAADELPMLFFVGALSLCCLDTVLHADSCRAAGSKWLTIVMLSTTAVVAGIYTLQRAQFAVFFVCFTGQVVCIIAGFVWLWVCCDWATLGGSKGVVVHVAVFNPFCFAICWCVFFGMWAWFGEMAFCDLAATHNWPVRFMWNRLLHPLWHCFTSIVAYLCVQALTAAYGLLICDLVPSVRWCVLPYVTFPSACSKKPKSH